MVKVCGERSLPVWLCHLRSRILSGDDTVESTLDRIPLMLNDKDHEDLGIAPLFSGQSATSSTPA